MEIVASWFLFSLKNRFVGGWLGGRVKRVLIIIYSIAQCFFLISKGNNINVSE